MTVNVLDLVFVVVICVLALRDRPIRSRPLESSIVVAVPIALAFVSLLFPQSIKLVLQVAAAGYLLVASVIERMVLARRYRAWQRGDFDRRLDGAILDVTDANLAIWRMGPTEKLVDRSTAALDRLRVLEAPTSDWAAIRDSYVPPLIRARMLSVDQEPAGSFNEVRREMDLIADRRRILLERP